jgi:hypothetical protein
MPTPPKTRFSRVREEGLAPYAPAYHSGNDTTLQNKCASQTLSGDTDINDSENATLNAKNLAAFRQGRFRRNEL